MLKVDEDIKKDLRKIYGKVFNSLDEVRLPKDADLVTVGDRISFNAIIREMKPRVIVYDGKEKKKTVEKNVLETLEKFEGEKIIVSNPPSHLNEELFDVAEKVFKTRKKFKIFIEGEEDLATLALAFKAPLGTYLMYGLIDKGILLKIDKNIKEKCRELISRIRARSSAW